MHRSRHDCLPGLAAALIVLAGLAAYCNSLSGPFVFDDIESIPVNQTLRHLWPITGPLHPPHDGSPVEGRPIVNLSFAINYAIGGLDVRGYHAVNLAIHLLAGLALFGVIRRTLQWGRCFVADRAAADAPLRPDSTVFASGAALLWTVHPLQTEAVTYISQRAESLMGLFYLVTLYTFVRGSHEADAAASSGARAASRLGSMAPVAWYTACVLFCLLGMATKEVMVSAPLIVFLHDRTFVAGSFREAWRRRRRLYAALGATWIALAWLVADSGANRAGTAGVGTSVAWWRYALTQCQAVAHYLKLAFWPHPLVLDYGWDLAGSFRQVAPQASLVLLLALGTILALRCRSAIGFLGAFFFAVLAPSSSVVPVVSETVAEHRMYLPLAAVLVAALWWVLRALDSLDAFRLRIPGARGGPGGRDSAAIVVIAVLAVGLGCATSRRNETFRTAVGIWSDTVRHRPGNPRAHYLLGLSMEIAGRRAEARGEYEEAVRVDPGYYLAHFRLANELANEGRIDEAIAHFEETLRLNPRFADAHNNLGRALAGENRTAEAIAQFEEALSLAPDLSDAHYNLAAALVMSGRTPEAIGHFEAAARLNPDRWDIHYNFASVLMTSGRIPEAIGQLRETERLVPGDPDVHRNLGLLLRSVGRESEAAAELAESYRLRGGSGR